MDKRYQVFVSSTYADLKEERQQVIQTLMEMDCIPSGMELFPAADEEQFEFIKHVIDDCDYYLLIIGGRYGSTTVEGVSYTEKEYEYAISKQLKVIALLHDDPEAIPLGKSEHDPELRERLQRFRERVSRGRLVKFWSKVDDLPGIVALSMSKAIKMFPAIGWVRADKSSSEDLLAEINSLRKRNELLQGTVSELTSSPKSAIENLAGLEEETIIKVEFHDSYLRRRKTDEIRTTWRSIFGYIAPYLVQFPNDQFVKEIISRAYLHKIDSMGDASNPDLDDQDFRTIGIQLKALGLVKITYSKSTTGVMALFWSLTPAGERLMMEYRTVKRAPSTAQS